MNEPAHSAPNAPGATPATEGAVARVFVICNKKGLHARASAKFVQTVEKFDADVRVKRCGDGHETVGGTSIMGLMMLAAAPGTSIAVEATGPQAAEVVDALAALIESRFGEAD
jgi:phosphocarrier protein HPr